MGAAMSAEQPSPPPDLAAVLGAADRAHRDGRAIAGRARAAREQSRRLIATSVAMIERSARLVDTTFSRVVRRSDTGETPWSDATAAFIRTASLWNGRDPAIEDAKTVLATELGISRGDAYGVLHELSRRQRRRVRDIAREIADPRRR